MLLLSFLLVFPFFDFNNSAQSDFVIFGRVHMFSNSEADYIIFYEFVLHFQYSLMILFFSSVLLIFHLSWVEVLASNSSFVINFGLHEKLFMHLVLE